MVVIAIVVVVALFGAVLPAWRIVVVDDAGVIDDCDAGIGVGPKR